MESTGYEPLRRHPGGDGPSSNGGIRSSGKTLHKTKVLPTGSSGSLKSSSSLPEDGSSTKNPKNSRRELQEEMTAVQSPIFFHPVTPGSKPGVRKTFPVARDSANMYEMDRNVRQRPFQGTPYNLIHFDRHAEKTFVPIHIK